MRLDLNYLNLSAFRNFDKNQEITLPVNQVIAIVGKDKDEGGSNGTGKSSFSMSPLVNLFGAKFAGMSIKNLENRYLNEVARIVGKYTLDGVELIVDRTLGGKLSFTYGGVANKDGKAEDVQAALNEILKIKPEQLEVLSSKPQGEMGGFLLMPDAEKKDFLSSFFDVSFVEKAKDDADLELTTKTKSLTSLNGKLQYINDSYKTLCEEHIKAFDAYMAVNTDAYRADIQALKNQWATLDSNRIALDTLNSQSTEDFTAYAMTLPDVARVRDESNTKIAALNAQLSNTTTQMAEQTAKIAELEGKILSVPGTPQSLLDQEAKINDILRGFEDRRNKINKLNGSLVMTEMKLTMTQTQLNQAKEELDLADNAKCSSCGSPLSAEKTQERRAKIEASIVTLQNSIGPITNDIDTIKKQMSELTVSEEDQRQGQAFKDAILAQIAAFKAENSPESLRKELQSVRLVLGTLSMTKTSIESSIQSESKTVAYAIGKVKDTLSQHLSSIKLDLLNLKDTITNKEAQVTALLNEVTRIEKTKENSRAEHEKLTKEQSQLTDDIEVLNHVTKVTSKTGFVGYIFDSMLEDLNSEINENLKLIPNVRKFSLQFSSDKITKSTGAVSKAITYQINSGSEKVEWETLSGGEKLSMILAVDESLDSVLSKRIGIKIGWKFLDEQFFWIDENSKEAILDFYRTKASDRAYFIVDHASEFNAAFDNKIVIVKENNIARFAS